MTGKSPPDFVTGYSLNALSEADWDKLHQWAVDNVRPSWLTGIALLEVAEDQVEEAVSNGNIPPPPPESRRFDYIERRLAASRRRYNGLLSSLADAVKDGVPSVMFAEWNDAQGAHHDMMIRGNNLPKDLAVVLQRVMLATAAKGRKCAKKVRKKVSTLRKTRSSSKTSTRR